MFVPVGAATLKQSCGRALVGSRDGTYLAADPTSIEGLDPDSAADFFQHEGTILFTADTRGLEGRFVDLYAFDLASLPLPGDLDQNGTVDFTDFLVLSENFGKREAKPDEGDINEDGEISFEDFLLLQNNFGRRA